VSLSSGFALNRFSKGECRIHFCRDFQTESIRGEFFFFFFFFGRDFTNKDDLSYRRIIAVRNSLAAAM
jgi:hypothetical protein